MTTLAARFPGRTAAALIVALGVGAAATARAEPPTGVFTYTINNDRLGDVGVYTNTVRRQGNETVVENRTEIAVKWLFVTVFRFSASSTAVWRAGRMVRYDAVTEDDGKRFTVGAHAEGECLVIEGTVGRFVAPAGVYPHNPWSMAILEAGTIMSPKSGEPFPARITAKGREDIDLGDRTASTRSWRIDTDRRTWVWYDGAGVPVKFAMERKRGRELLTFTLRSVQ